MKRIRESITTDETKSHLKKKKSKSIRGRIHCINQFFNTSPL